jgi:hypothetical protein
MAVERTDVGPLRGDELEYFFTGYNIRHNGTHITAAPRECLSIPGHESNPMLIDPRVALANCGGHERCPTEVVERGELA